MKHTQIFSFFAIITLTIVSLMPLLQAEEYTKSSRKEIAFTFYKMIEDVPDFNVWAEFYYNRNKVRFAELGERDFIASTKKDLMKEFSKLDPSNHLLVVDHKAVLEALPVGKNNTEKYYINTYFEKSPPFIAYDIPRYRVNIVVPKIEDEIKFVISQSEYKRFNDTFYNRVRKYNTVHVRMILKPIRVDKDNPIMRDDKKYHLMLTELVDFEIRNDNSRRKYWPLPPTKDELNKAEDQKAKDDFMSKYQ